ncbi:hypothetical protein G4B88_007321 [Cannabis sativa]|uniref:RING-type E3 ubiquitin transferase n=1 Tax=Cannabis sativa TaxID=3483 RepID=A0A7J6FRM9_CANSA|nr:hypothetical protein G4B88_007321 [Cannabis sativa]
MGGCLSCFYCFNDNEAINISNSNNENSSESEVSSLFNEDDQSQIYKQLQEFHENEECPTCLEVENPRITTKCFHHFHLSCIYEWEQRSPLCPICNRIMQFDE